MSWSIILTVKEMADSESRKGRRAQVEKGIGLVIVIITALGVLFLAFGGLFPTMQTFGIRVPEETLADMQRSYILSACNGWLDAGGLEISYNSQIYDAVRATKLGWDDFCSPNAIKEPMNRCTCVKACTKAVSADKKCSLNPNTYKPDLFVPDEEDPEVGTVTTAAETKEGVSFKRAGTYCVLDFLRSLKEIDRTCRPESDTADIISISTRLAYTHDPISGYGTVEPNNFWGSDGTPIPNIQEMKVTCLATCRVAGGCEGVSLSVNYGCYSYRPPEAIWEIQNKEHCCARSISEYPGSRQIVPAKSIPMTSNRCFDGSTECYRIDDYDLPPYTEIVKVEGSAEGPKYELVRMEDSAQACDRISEGETCTKEFTIRAPDEVFSAVKGASSLENLAVICKGMYQGDEIFSETTPILTVLSSKSIYSRPAWVEAYKAFLCLPTGDEATNLDAPCRRISESMKGTFPGTPYDFSKEARMSCT
ncbi:MAG: hypothetical protein V1820_01200 [archaeon]